MQAMRGGQHYMSTTQAPCALRILINISAHDTLRGVKISAVRDGIPAVR